VSTNVVTLIKVAGPLVTELKEVFRTAEGAAGGSAPGRASSRTISRVTNSAAGRQLTDLIGLIEAHASYPPVVFYSRYIDPWTISPCLTFLSSFTDHEIYAISLEVWGDVVLMAQRDPSLLRYSVDDFKARVADDKSSPEWRYFANQLDECVQRWQDISGKNTIDTAILVMFRGVGASWTDDELLAACRTLPAWAVSSHFR